MKLALLSIALCVVIYAASATKLVASSSRALNRRETNLVKRLVKRQAYNDPNCDPRRCPQINCGKDSIAGTLPNECCQRCIPWEYAKAIGLYPRGPEASQDSRPQPQPQPQDNYNQYQYNQPQQRVDVYIYGPDDGARVSAGQSIYFDCEVVSPYNQYAQPRWSRAGNQQMPYKSQSTVLAGNRKLARLTIPDATQSDAGRYECSAGTGNPSDQASIDLQVSDGGYYPRPPQPQPQPQPAQPQYPSYDPYNQPGYYPQQPVQPQYPPYDPYNQPGQYPPQPQPQPQPENPSPAEPAGDDGDDGDDGSEDGQDQEPAPAMQPTQPPAPAPAPAAPEETADDGEEDTEYPEDYTENEK